MDTFFLIESVVKIFTMIAAVMGLATILTWVERKQSAVMQDRIGANRADIFGIRIIGLFQPFADAIKMITKEDYIPPFGNKVLHMIAPAIAYIPVMLLFAVIPMGPPLEIGGRIVNTQIANIDIGLLFIFAFGGIAVYGAVIGGWASNNKYALIAAIRTSAQMISYEVCLGLSLIGAIMIYGTVDLSQMIAEQSGHWFGWIPRWGIFIQPLGALLFIPAAIAENKRIPFDLPEAESEIIGYYTEYSGLKGGLFMMTEFIEMVLISALFSVIFLGGWNVPWLEYNGFNFPWGGTWTLNIWVVKGMQFGAYFLKVAVLIYFFTLVRWTLPRFRYDQVMRLGWRYLFPLALINLLITGIAVVLFA
ncbi:MAG: NADH-quinone oxidoreductase subunit NuoH [Calditrichaeota bacterium]|jgi:NADH-quinone oxidoreductase subunit H|nr:NADH-quinone oxidoreductase subunit NuoH [Calditrichota bacterium]MBT7617691.1 NADH-quinone oxidoreductase subunit NuoH [Calditrichota bacterium]MBT7788358.1 NADH-quinone oxidoreductase subunit NuoH [Calditrichota bacterium]